MERKERIYEFISSNEYIPMKPDELKVMLGVPEEDFEEFIRILKELEDEGKIFLTKKGRYESSKKAGLICGIISCSAYGKFAFLRPLDENEDELYISSEKLKDAYNGDTVFASVDVKNPKTGRSEGHVVRVIKRGNERITGIVNDIYNQRITVIPDSKKIYAVAYANVGESDYSVGDRVLLEICDYISEGKIGAIAVKNLGNSSELKSNIEGIIYEHFIKQEFDEETLFEAQNAPKRVSQKEIAKRLDLREEIIFTIDGDDARDFDDAVSLEIDEKGDYILGVHIADVTSYVTPGSSLDKEAFMRGTSVYLPDRVIPMLPVELSNGICSLNPHVNRLTLSVFIRIDKKGNAQLEKMAKSVIRSCERMTYNDVADLLENPTKRLLKKYEYLLPTLTKMQELASILNKKRMERGSINFDFPEAHIVVNDVGEPIDIVRSERRVSHKMIEEFMLIANETVAELAFWSELPFVYRVHEAPTPEKTEDFNRFIFNFGYMIKGHFDSDNPIHPKAFGQILDKIKGTDEESMISTYMLRSLMKAEYRSENLGHFGLCAKFYCHFTSPIRRYPDLFIHRVLKSYLDGEDVTKYISLCDEVAENSSDTEREAEYCERDTDDLMKAAYMSAYIGETFSGKVSSVTNFGFFVELDNTVEGLIRLDSMKDDFYEYDENARIIRGKRTEKSYRIGDRIDVIVTQCDLLTRKIDFMRDEDYGYYKLIKSMKEVNRQHKPKKGRKTKKPKTKRKEKRRRHG